MNDTELLPGVSCAAIVHEGDFTAQRIGKAFESVADGVDEFVLVHTGKTDWSGFDDPDYFEGRERCAPAWLNNACGGKRITIFESAWCWDFSHSRNYGLDRCKHEWLFIIDADEQLEADAASVLKQLADLEDNAIGYFVQTFMYQNSDEPTSIVSSMRLFLNTPKQRYEGFIHNQLQFEGIAGNVDIPLHHRGAEGEDHGRRMERNKRFREKLVAHLEEHPDDLSNLFNMIKTLSYDLRCEEVIEWATKLLEKITIADMERPTKAEVDRAKAYHRTFYMLGFALNLTGDHSKALEIATLGAMYSPSVDLFFVAGNASYMMGDFVNADLFWQRYLMQLPIEQSGTEHVVVATGTFKEYVTEKLAILHNIRKYGPDPFEVKNDAVVGVFIAKDS